jgi:hypothetical protein
MATAPGVVDDLQKRQGEALERCERQIAWYDEHAQRSWWLQNGFQVATVVLGALTPLILIDKDFAQHNPILVAIPAALASVVAAINGIFKWREDGVRFGYIREALKSELIKFKTRTAEYGTDLTDEQALDKFVTRIEQLAMSEVTEWRTQRREDADKQKNKE